MKLADSEEIKKFALRTDLNTELETTESPQDSALLDVPASANQLQLRATDRKSPEMVGTAKRLATGSQSQFEATIRHMIDRRITMPHRLGSSLRASSLFILNWSLRMKNPRMFAFLRKSAEADKEKAIMSLELLSEHPAGIGDHSTEDFYKNAEEALALLADAEDRLEMLDKHYPNVGS